MATNDTTTETTAPSKTAIRDYTRDVPMIDLEEIVGFAKKIREEALETATMTEVAKKFGYKAATSSPMYRRMVAARLFGFLGKNGPALTARATDFLKPSADDARTKALTEAIKGIVPYSELISKLEGKKVNLELISNGFEKKLNISSVAAKICARVFEKSLRFAGFLGSDDIVLSKLGGAVPALKGQDPDGDHEEEEHEDDDKNGEKQTHTLYLGTDKSRKFIVTAPLDVSQAELARINGWLKFTLLVDQPSVPAKPGEQSI